MHLGGRWYYAEKLATHLNCVYVVNYYIIIAGLFQRAILMSGSGASTWSMVEDPVHYAVKLAAHLNCTLPANMLKNHLNIVDCLRYIFKALNLYHTHRVMYLSIQGSKLKRTSIWTQCRSIEKVRNKL